MSDKTPEQQPVIRLENLSKRFETVSGTSSSFLGSLVSRFSPSQEAKPKREEQPLWAVKDVNLEVKPGEALGILGRNGSGKSTLLKLITRIIQPTNGRISINGRVSALLELGTGFHGDLSGRENIYLNASLLGLDNQYINTLFDSIVAFSELESFIDTPVKFYSSGMYMRLGFSVAVHVPAQILIIDEILAVGDQSFQDKCINHIYELKRKGVTIILVSHNLDTMRKLCSRLIWMEQGQIRASGPSEELIQRYLLYLHDREHQTSLKQEADFLRLGTCEIEIMAVRMLDTQGKESNHFLTGDSLTIEISYIAHKAIQMPEFGLAIYRQDDIQVNGPNSQLAGLRIEQVEGEGKVYYHVHQLPLLPAEYLLSVAVHDSRYTLTYDHHVKAYKFQVDSGGTKEIYGLIEIPATWSWESAKIEAEK